MYQHTRENAHTDRKSNGCISSICLEDVEAKGVCGEATRVWEKFLSPVATILGSAVLEVVCCNVAIL